MQLDLIFASTITSEDFTNLNSSKLFSWPLNIDILKLNNSLVNNFTIENARDFSIRDFFQYAYRMSFNKKNTIIITIILSIISIIGSVSNLLVLIVFTLRDDCMEFDAIKKNRSVINKPNSKLHIVSYFKNSKSFTAKPNNSTKSTKPIYLLIKYLAFVDFLTCFLVIPGIIYELWFLSSSNEILCKSFEFIRGTGVVLSNFLVILISFERYMLLCKPLIFIKFRNFLFKRLLIIITLLSLFIGGVAMLQMSVYQLDENGDVTLTYICLPSSVILSEEFREKINMTFIYVFLTGAIVVGCLYIFIFYSAFKLNQKRANRMRMNEKMFSNASKYSSGKFSGQYSNEILSDKQTPNTMNDIKSFNGQINLKINNFQSETDIRDPKDSNSKKRKKKSSKFKNKITTHKRSFTIFKSNMRIALMIFFVTLSYYVSVIPWCIIKNGIIKFNLFIYYTFLLNNSLNPIIYGFFNPNFRHYCFEILRSIFRCNSKYVVKNNKNSENQI